MNIPKVLLCLMDFILSGKTRFMVYFQAMEFEIGLRGTDGLKFTHELVNIPLLAEAFYQFSKDAFAST